MNVVTASRSKLLKTFRQLELCRVDLRDVIVPPDDGNVGEGAPAEQGADVSERYRRVSGLISSLGSRPVGHQQAHSAATVPAPTCRISAERVGQETQARAVRLRSTAASRVGRLGDARLTEPIGRPEAGFRPRKASPQRPIIFLMFGQIAENARETRAFRDPDFGLRTSRFPAPPAQKLGSSVGAVGSASRSSARSRSSLTASGIGPSGGVLGSSFRSN